MYFTIYKTTNLINGKYYIGKHQTNNINDNYLGSGKRIKRAISKYGSENFIKEIIHVFDNKEDMDSKERELVNNVLITSNECYNIKLGGEGGFDHINLGNAEHIARCKRAYKSLAEMPIERIKERNKKAARARIEKHPELSCKTARRGHDEGWFSWKGKSHTDESKRRIGEANSRLTGKLNHRFGTMWITNGIESVVIYRTSAIPEGWWRGRKVKRVS